jgi:hypothetical protein
MKGGCAGVGDRAKLAEPGRSDCVLAGAQELACLVRLNIPSEHRMGQLLGLRFCLFKKIQVGFHVALSQGCNRQEFRGAHLLHGSGAGLIVALCRVKLISLVGDSAQLKMSRAKDVRQSACTLKDLLISVRRLVQRPLFFCCLCKQFGSRESSCQVSCYLASGASLLKQGARFGQISQ